MNRPALQNGYGRIYKEVDMFKNIRIIIFTVIFIMFFLPAGLPQTDAGVSAVEAVSGTTESVSGADATATQAETEAKAAEEKKAKEKKEEEEKKAKEEKEKQEAEEAEPPAPEENLDTWGEEYNRIERDYHSDDTTNNIWKDNQGFIDR